MRRTRSYLLALVNNSTINSNWSISKTLSVHAKYLQLHGNHYYDKQLPSSPPSFGYV